jgi:hypothetical protein
MDKMLTATCTHQNKPTGAGSFVTVSAGISCTAADPLDRTWAQAYPTDKMLLMRQLFTKYAAFASGERCVVGSTTYVVSAVHPYAAQGGMDAFYFLILEEQSGS